MSWVISQGAEVLLQSGPGNTVTGLMVDGFNGQLMMSPSIRLSPVGPTINLPPKNEAENFLVAFVYLRDMVDGAKLTYKAPPGIDAYLGPNDGRIY